MNTFLLLLIQLVVVAKVAHGQNRVAGFDSNNPATTGCPVEDDPSQLARCIQIDVTAIVEAIHGSQDYTSFCALANRYMECFSTYTRGCPGQYFASGGFSELENIAQYCCNGITSTNSCPFNSNAKHSCIDADATAMLADGTQKLVKSLQIGDKVKTLNQNGQVVDTDVVMMMDLSHEESLFLNIRTYSEKSVKVSTTHLMAVPNGEFKFAKNLRREDTIVTFDFEANKQVEEKIKSIMIEPVQGYAAPLTMSGTILVDGILASCYAIIDSQTVAHSVMAPARWWYAMHGMLDQVAPESLASHLQIAKQMNGTHWYPAMLESFTQQYLTKVITLH